MQEKKTSRFTSGKHWLRLGTVFSAAMVVMSMISNLGTQIGNKLSVQEEKAPAAQASNGLLPYETPAFSIFSSVTPNEAQAGFVNLGLGLVGRS